MRSGPENFFLFGLTEQDVERLQSAGYRPADYIDRNDELRDVLAMIAEGRFTDGDNEIFRPLVDSLTHSDAFLVLADYAAYIDCQARVSAAWQDKSAWTRMSILNTARSATFSSDRAIVEYCDDIWDVHPVSINI